MPAPQDAALSQARGARPILGHVNLMVDTFIANASIDDLRAIVRGTLASSAPAVATIFSATARRRLAQTDATALPSSTNLFTNGQGNGAPTPTTELADTLSRVRALYGAGLGFASLRVLAVVIRATLGLRWEAGSGIEDTWAAIDADISQALQSSREEMEAGRAGDMVAAREAVEDLRSALQASVKDVESWNGNYPFERGVASLEFWKI